MLLVDPKRVELTAYEGIPHLVTPIIPRGQPRHCSGWCARWIFGTRILRHSVSSTSTTSTRQSGPGRSSRRMTGKRGRFVHAAGRSCGRVPRLVVIVDELSDLMMVAPRDVEDSIVRITQLARAARSPGAGHQRPSTDVVTGLIKANVPSRLSFATSSMTDSR